MPEKENKDKENKKEKENKGCPLCSVSEETIRKLKTVVKQKKPEKEKEEQS